MKHCLKNPSRVLLLLALLALPTLLLAQSENTETEDDDIVMLSPFEVTSEDDDGYLATATLAGSRIKTDLKDVASSITVVTSEFLKDTGARNNQDLLVYTTNTEVGGVYGNYAGVGTTFIAGGNESSNFLKPNNNTRVRGLDSADNTRDFFLTDVPWDAYVVERVELQRGPNSILFGFGSPAGIVNSGLVKANVYENKGSIENRIGQFGSLRFSADYNQVIINDLFAVRVAALDDKTKYRQDPAYNHDRRLFGAFRFQPRIFSGLDSRTTIRGNFEHGEINARRPRVLPPEDRISTFFQDDFGKQTYDTYTAWEVGNVPYSNAGNEDPTRGPVNPWLVQYMGPGLQVSANAVVYYDAETLAGPMEIRQAGPITTGGLGTRDTDDDGIADEWFYDDGISGFPFGSTIGIGSYNEWSKANTVSLPAADSGFYKNKSMTDSSIFDFYNNLIDGPNKKEWQNWDAYNLSLSHTILNNRAGIEVVYDRQKYNDGQMRNMNGTYISVDIREYNNDYPAQYDYAALNPNAGRAFVGSSTKNGGNSINKSDRENIRVTLFGEIRADDLFSRSKLTDIIGRHIFTGLYSKDTQDLQNANFVRYALDSSYTTAIHNQNGGLTNGDVALDWVTYLSGDLRSLNSASGLNLQPIKVKQSPSGTVSVKYYDATWNYSLDPNAPDFVDPTTTWINPSRSPDIENVIEYQHIPYNYIAYEEDLEGNPTALDPEGNVITDTEGWYAQDPFGNNITDTDGWYATDPFGNVITEEQGSYNYYGEVSTEAENPANYVGWTTSTFDILSADQGDIEKLYTDASRVHRVTKSHGLTWQGYLFNDNLVATVGWREDERKQQSGNSAASLSATGAASTEIRVDPFDPDPQKGMLSKGDSVSWGLVAHVPESITRKLPLGTRLSFAYSKGSNTRVENRYGFGGDPLQNAEGETDDFSVIFNTLNDRLMIKTTWYKTVVTNANISSVTTEVSTLGANTYYLRNLEAWGTASALMLKAGHAGDENFTGYEWYWNYALIAENWDSAYSDPTSEEYLNHPETPAAQAAADSWLSQLLPQSWFDAYGFPVDVGLAEQGDWNGAVGNWTPSAGVGGIQPSGGGRINGSWPTGTVNNESKGVEIEIVGKPTDNLNISMNISKVKAAQTSLGPELMEFIEAAHEKYSSPAGDLRLWWGGDQEIRNYFNENIWSAYQFQLAGNGRMVPEMAPWRVNTVINYNFSEGRLAGSNIGISYRWQDSRIVGYELNETQDNLDVDKPYWSTTEDHLDLWMGYGRDISEKLHWRIQLNLRNVGENPHLSVLSVQPDGSPAMYRIMEGQTWSITNTISF